MVLGLVYLSHPIYSPLASEPLMRRVLSEHLLCYAFELSPRHIDLVPRLLRCCRCPAVDTASCPIGALKAVTVSLCDLKDGRTQRTTCLSSTRRLRAEVVTMYAQVVVTCILALIRASAYSISLSHLAFNLLQCFYFRMQVEMNFHERSSPDAWQQG